MIQPEDFVSIVVDVKMRNLVSETMVNSNENSIQLLEIVSDGLVLSLPKLSCSLGHTLELQLIAKNLVKSPFTIKLIGRVIGIENISNLQDRVTISINNVLDQQWLDFCYLLKKRQEAIHEFLKNAKGY